MPVFKRAKPQVEKYENPEGLDISLKTLSLFSITWPIFIEMALYFATTVINTMMVGWVSVKAVGELTIGNQVFFLALIIFNFFNIGVSVVCAQALGARNKSLVRRLIHVGYGVNVITGTIVSLGIFAGSELIVGIMQVPAELVESSNKYLEFIALALLPLALSLVSSAVLRAHNFTRETMYISFFVNVLTVLGNACFLFGYLGFPILGVEGVAISTAFARAVGCIIFIIVSLKLTRTRIIPRFLFVFPKKVIYSILNIGVPGACENFAWQTQNMFLTGVVASMGAIQLSTFGIYGQVIQFLLLACSSIGMGNEIIIARHTGAMRLDDAHKQVVRSVKIGFGITVLSTFSLPLGLGAFLLGLFTDDMQVLALATPLFLVSVFHEPGRVLNIIIINSLRATGDTKFPVVMAIISMWGISVPLGTFLGLYMEWGLVGVWLGFATDEWFRGIAMLLRWRSNIWRKTAKKVYEQTLQSRKIKAV